MKYGETFRQRSIPEWGHYNVDYDDIKHLIKEHTTPGNGKAVSIPGQGNTAEKAFETQLYGLLCEQHQRIDLFVKSKTGEIERRLAHSSRQIAQLASLSPPPDGRLSAKRLERYAKIEGEVLKAGQDIRSLSRFIGAQRLAFTKLLKKYKKWTGSESLVLRFKHEVLDQPGNFCTLDLGSLLDYWTDVLHDVRAPFEAGVLAKDSGKPTVKASFGVPATQKREGPVPVPAKQIQAVIEDGSELDFDCAMDTVPIGNPGGKATYWIHPDNVVELQVLLMQHMRLFVTKGKPRTPTYSTPLGTLSRRDSYTQCDRIEDTGTLVIDNLATFTQKQNGATISDSEATPGRSPIQAAGTARWTINADAVVIVGFAQTSNADFDEFRSARLKRKHLGSFLDPHKPSNVRRLSTTSISTENGPWSAEWDAESLDRVRQWLSQHDCAEPVAGICTKRTRFVGLANNSSSGLWAVLDQDISMKRDLLSDLADNDWAVKGRHQAYSFPYAVLEVRQEGNHISQLIRQLDKSHLTERVRGFSLETHAVWMCCKPEDMSPPIWLPILERDIRKVPEDVSMRRPRTVNFSTDAHSSASPTSTTDGEYTTCTSPGRNIESSATSVADHLEAPPLSAFKQKRRTTYRQHSLSKKTGSGSEAPPRYWSEYDHPEDSSDDDAYVIYVDPNATTKIPGQDTIAAWAGKVRALLKRTPSTEAAPLLADTDRGFANPGISDIDDDTTSSDEAAQARARRYGTMFSAQQPFKNSGGYFRSVLDSVVPERPSVQKRRFLGSSDLEDNTLLSAMELRQHEHEIAKFRFYSTSLLASVVVLLMLIMLAATGRRKLAGEVDAGIIFGIIANLLFAATAVGSMLTRQEKLSWIHRGLVILVFVGVVVADGALLSWIVTG